MLDRQTLPSDRNGQAKSASGGNMKISRRTTNVISAGDITQGHLVEPSLRYDNTSSKPTSAKRQRRDNPFEEIVQDYKADLIDRLNQQMTEADEEVNASMKELGGQLDEGLKIIDEVGRPFGRAIAEDRLQIGEEGKEQIEVVVDEVMSDLKGLIRDKEARLGELKKEYEAVHRQIADLAIAILGEEHVHMVPKKQENPANRPHAEKERDQSLQHVYRRVEDRLDDIQTQLDGLVLRSLEENKTALKAFQANRRSKQGEVSKLLSSWSQT